MRRCPEAVARLGDTEHVDNVLRGGAAADAGSAGASGRALRELDSVVAGDPRVDAVMLPVADLPTLGDWSHFPRIADAVIGNFERRVSR